MSNTEAVVWVTQVPNRRDRGGTGAMVPAVNIAPASEHGEVKIMMPPHASFFATGDMVSQLRTRLRDYNFERGDSLIALGDPAIIAACGAILGERHKAFNILRWDKMIGRYVKIKVAL